MIPDFSSHLVKRQEFELCCCTMGSESVFKNYKGLRGDGLKYFTELFREISPWKLLSVSIINVYPHHSNPFINTCSLEDSYRMF